MAAARHHHIVDRLKATGVAALADLCFPGLGEKGRGPVDGGRLGCTVAHGLQRLDEARRLGVTVVDTADEYGGGQSEVTVGEWLRSRKPDDVLIATKVGVVFSDGRRRIDLSAPAHAYHRPARPRPGWVQNQLNLLSRADERDVLPRVTAEGLGYAGVAAGRGCAVGSISRPAPDHQRRSVRGERG